MRPKSHLLEDDVRSLFCESLRVCASGDEAFDWLIARGAKALVEEMAAENEKVVAELVSLSIAKIAVLNRPELVHFAIVVRASSESTGMLLRAIEDRTVADFFPLSGIWRHYAAALVKFHRGEPCERQAMKPKGYEKFMVPYVAYMCSATEEEREQAKAHAAKSFSERNADRRYIDWVGLDGDGKKPTRWDFRMFALERAQHQT
jgi:hypothetical protein